jgi:hypothetical protein
MFSKVIIRDPIIIVFVRVSSISLQNFTWCNGNSLGKTCVMSSKAEARVYIIKKKGFGFNLHSFSRHSAGLLPEYVRKTANNLNYHG